MERCEKHPKYNGKKVPKYECTNCLSFYFMINNKPRAGVRLTKVEKNKKTYDRKNKEWKDDKS